MKAPEWLAAYTKLLKSKKVLVQYNDKKGKDDVSTTNNEAATLCNAI
jgi:hypothetical protein